MRPPPAILLALLALPASAAARPAPRKLTRAILDRSLRLGQRFLVANQREDGDFAYHYDLRSGRAFNPSLHSLVRQAGALWGLALTQRARPAPHVEDAVHRGLTFFLRDSARVGKLRFLKPTARDPAATGAVALWGLALLESDRFPLRDRTLGEVFAFVRSLRRADGRFASGYDARGEPRGQPNPYYDGEALLFLVRAARHLKRSDLGPRLVASAEAMHRRYVTEALKADPDSNLTKGYFLWATQAYHALVESGWAGTAPFARRAVDLGTWMVDVHKPLERPRNTAYAHEGLVYVWVLARRLKATKTQAKLAAVIDRGLYALTRWQVGGPLENAYLRACRTRTARALGGVLNHAREPWLRIDVTQHQMHAVILARRYLYPARR